MKTLQSIEVLNALYSRHAIRRYTERAPEKSELLTLIDAAIQAPSSMNRQEWAFAVVQGASRLERYSEEAKAHYRAQPGGALAHALSLLDREENIFHGAPALVIICSTSPTQQAAEDCCLAAQNFMLAAFAQGWGTCPIGFARPWLTLAETKAELGIPAELTPVFAVVVGEPAETPASHGRRPPVVVWV